MSDEYEGPIELEWDNDRPDGIDADVVDALRQELAGLEAPADLILHTVQLTHDFHGPSVLVSGKEGSDKFHCAYYPTIVSVEEDSDDCLKFAPGALEAIKEISDKDPKVGEAFRDMFAKMRQAATAVKSGQYRSFPDAMEAITGQRPEPVYFGDDDDDLAS